MATKLFCDEFMPVFWDAILIDVVYTFAKHTACDGCKLDKEGIEELKRIFAATARKTEGMPGRWEEENDKGRNYVLIQVARIGKEACAEAKRNNNGVISKEILHDAADKVITLEQEECKTKKEFFLMGRYCDKW